MIVASICVIVKEATKIPLAIFTDLFHHRFRKKTYLESTLEILQKFYIKLVNHSNTFRIWVGDLHKYCLHCTRCHRAITRPDCIHLLIKIAPIAMLWHLEIASDVHDYPHCPVVLPYREAMYYSCSQFEDSKEEIDDNLPSPFLQCNASQKLSMSWYNSKNQNKTHITTIKNTISLVSSLFVDMIDVDMAVKSGFLCTMAEIKESPITVANSVIWNRGKSKEPKRFLFEPEGYSPSIITRYQLEQLRLYKGWYAFCHNEYKKNLLCIHEEITRRIYGTSATIPNRFLEAFSLDHKEIKLLVERRAKHTSKHLPYHFKTRLNDVDGIIIGGGVVACPLQFQLGKLPTMNGIIEKQDPRWDDIDEKPFSSE